MTVQPLSDYARWVELLGDRFFPPGDEDAAVLFCIDDDELEEMSEGQQLIPLADAVNLQCPQVLSDSRWSAIRTDPESSGYPLALPVLAVMVLAVSHQQTNAFYRPFRELVGPSLSEQDDGQPPGFFTLITEWKRVAAWAATRGRGRLDLGKQHGTWDKYFYPARRHAIFKARNLRRDLPRFFAERGLLVVGEKLDLRPEEWDRETDVFLAWCGKQADTKLRSYERIQSSDLRSEIRERLEAAYADWDGSIEDERGYSNLPRLKLCWEIDRLLPAGGHFFVSIPTDIVLSRLGLDPGSLSACHVRTGAAASSRLLGSFVALDVADQDWLTADDIFSSGKGDEFAVTDSKGHKVTLSLSPPLTHDEPAIVFRHLQEDAESYVFVERRFRSIQASSKVVVRSQDAMKLPTARTKHLDEMGGVRVLDGAESLFNRLDIPTDKKIDDLTAVGGLRTSARQWIDGAGPNLVAPQGTKALRVGRQGFRPIDFESASGIISWSDLEVERGGAFSIQALDDAGNELGVSLDLEFVSPESVLRRSRTPSGPSRGAPTLAFARDQRVPAASEWTMTIGALPGQISRRTFSAADARRLPNPQYEWFRHDSLLLTSRESRYQSIANVSSVDGRVEFSWAEAEISSSSPASSATKADSVMAMIWAAWLLVPRVAPADSLRDIQVAAAAVVLANQKEFSPDWIQRAKRLVE
jgi:hypothetical protein